MTRAAPWRAQLFDKRGNSVAVLDFKEQEDAEDFIHIALLSPTIESAHILFPITETEH